MWEIIIIIIKSAVSSNASMSRILAAAEHQHSTAGAAVQLAVGLQGQEKRPEVTAGKAQTC